MRKIEGQYITKDFKPVDYKAEIAGNWHELDAHQYATIMELLTLKKADRDTLAASMVAVLFGPKNWHILNNLTDELLHASVQLTNFIYESQPPANNFFPKLKIRKKLCIAPADDLSNIGFGEWCFIFQFYTYYLQTNDASYLLKLIATICRPAIRKRVRPLPRL